MTSFRLACACAIFAGVAGQAGAREDAVPTRAVSLAGVNFDNQADVSALYGRLKAAASFVCDTNSANPRITQMDQICAKQVLTEAIASAHQPALSALHDAATRS